VTTTSHRGTHGTRAPRRGRGRHDAPGRARPAGSGPNHPPADATDAAHRPVDAQLRHKHQPVDQLLRHRARAASTASARARSMRRLGHVYICGAPCSCLRGPTSPGLYPRPSGARAPAVPVSSRRAYPPPREDVVEAYAAVHGSGIPRPRWACGIERPARSARVPMP
jgi:hypothetical protein